MTLNRLNPLDARWLMMESRDTPMHVGTLLTFSIPDDAPASFLYDMADSFRVSKKLERPWNLKLRNHKSSSVVPRTEEVSEIDLGYHFRHSALPHPGGERELGILVSRLHSHPLDKQRPLWEMHLIEGLELNRFAVYLKVHPALINGSDVVPIVLQALSDNADDKDMPAFWTMNMHHEKGEDLEEHQSPSHELMDTLNRAGDSLLSAGRLTSKAMKSMFAEGLKAPRLAPRSSLNGAVNNQRRFATQQYEYSRFEALAKAADCTPNTILAYLCGSALRRFFKEYNALPDKPLVAAGALRLNDYADKHEENDEREVMANIGISLATHIADPLKRLQAVNRSMQRTREHLKKLPKEARAPYALMTSLPQIAGQIPGIGRLVPSMFNVGISNAVVSDNPLYFNGAQLEAMYPMAHLMQYSALSFDSAIYAGTVNIGLTGARDTLPRLQRMALYMDQALNDLETLLLNEEASV